MKKCRYVDPPEEVYSDHVDKLRKELHPDQVILPTGTRLQRVIQPGVTPQVRLSVLLMDSLSEVYPSNMLDLSKFEGRTTDSILHSQICRVLRSTGHSIDEFTSRYFNGIHRWLPIMSRKRFHQQSLNIQAIPNAQFSLLVLSMCLITQFPSSNSYMDQDRAVLYLATKTLFAQIQLSVPQGSQLYLIQAALIVAYYEHAHGMLESVYISIGTCARMATAAKLDPKTPKNTPMSSEDWLDREESRSLWCAIMICDRSIGCALKGRPLSMRSPASDDILPIELEDLDGDKMGSSLSMARYLVSDTSEPGLGTFAREAQAIYLLDQVLQLTLIKELDDLHISELRRLDAELQRFLSMVMKQCGGKWGRYCGAICGTITALFILHRCILAQSESNLAVCKINSQAALDTITRMIIAIAYDFVDNSPYFDIEILPPFVTHIARCAQRHAAIAPAFRDDAWAKDLAILQTWLEYFNRRWVLAGKELQRLNDVNVS